MGKIKESELNDYNEDLLDEEDVIDPEMDDEDKESLLEGLYPGYKRTWRDAEKYKEMRELYKIINDELYTGFDEDKYQDIDDR